MCLGMPLAERTLLRQDIEVFFWKRDILTFNRRIMLPATESHNLPFAICTTVRLLI
jgi:hypothetical protein